MFHNTIKSLRGCGDVFSHVPDSLYNLNCFCPHHIVLCSTFAVEIQTEQESCSENEQQLQGTLERKTREGRDNNVNSGDIYFFFP